MALHRLQILRECEIKPLIVVENKVREEIENYKQTVTNECIYYLSKFGTPERQAKFYRSNNQLEQALK
jgi:hypothetical protein